MQISNGVRDKYTPAHERKNLNETDPLNGLGKGLDSLRDSVDRLEKSIAERIVRF